jgi:hypothetical protein
MKRLGFVLILASAMLKSQEPASVEKLNVLADELSSAVEAGDWKKAAELSKELATSTTLVRNSSLARRTAEQVNQILRWFPADTETLLVAAEPLLLTDSNGTAMLSGKTLAQGYVTGLLRAPNEGKLYKSLAGRTLDYAVLGARRFGLQPDDGGAAMPLGMIAYQGCAAYGFEQPVDDRTLGVIPGAVIMERPVWLMEGKQYQQARDARPRTETHYVAFLKPDLMLVCNDKEFLTEILSRMKSPNSSRALPDSLAEWHDIDRSAPVWGLRHIARQRASVDPSLGQMVIEDAQAVGLALQVDIPVGKIEIRWLSTSPTNPWQTIADNPQFKGIQTRKAGQNLWEISGNSNEPSAYMLIFAVMAAMGFVVLV